MVALGTEPDDVLLGTAQPASPRASLSPGASPAWVAVVGVSPDPRGGRRSSSSGWRVALDIRCGDEERRPSGVAGVTGIGLSDPARILVPCGGLRPAPALLRSRGSDSIGKGRADGAAAQAGASLHGQGAGNVVAAGLLGIAALVMIAGALAWRHRGTTPLAAGSGEAASEPSSADDDEPPRLTLVGLPREHGP